MLLGWKPFVPCRSFFFEEMFSLFFLVNHLCSVISISLIILFKCVTFGSRTGCGDVAKEKEKCKEYLSDCIVEDSTDLAHDEKSWQNNISLEEELVFSGFYKF